MKVNDLTEENLSLKDGSYVIFDKNELVTDIIYFENKGWDEKPRFIYDLEHDESLEEFKNVNRDCEIFPIESIKKPQE